MKSLMKGCVLSVAMLILMCGVAGADDFNAKGSALVPNLQYCNNGRGANYYSSINITNITGNDVQCRVTMYDHDGLDITSLGQVYTGGGSAWTLLSEGTGDFEIPAHSTRFYLLAKAGIIKNITGYAVIEWKSDDPLLRKALIGGTRLWASSTAGQRGGNFLINNGQPF